MQSSQLWFKKLAKSRFSNGKWETEGTPPVGSDPFENLREDLLEMLNIYNQHTKSPIRALCPPVPGRTLVTLMYGATQMRMSQNDGYLDVSLIVTRHFQAAEIPLTRLTPRIDQFGSTSWHRGTADLSTEQVIKNAFIHLIEAADG
jgi:hypothetical protein